MGSLKLILILFGLLLIVIYIIIKKNLRKKYNSLTECDIYIDKDSKDRFK
ncbi:hypothetical protein [Metaclostridioides mangenotii]|uniref:Uncharacterized protein n=1 Tax=Metaclostridioides mangenotii TaxID=1540 RepID=A0ABS4EDT8_9FIRM|nr:hypothetical protein [Clostridioides mangenotii]MBP1856089.1 hypothetical protein [Clostridioides mangenotii]